MKIGIISDIHEDVASLEKVLRYMAKENCETVVCLGDILGFDETHYHFNGVPYGDECIRLVKENCEIALAGNHDLFAIRKIPQFSAGFIYPEGWYRLSRDERLRRINGRLWPYGAWEESRSLSGPSIEFLRHLPEFVTKTFDGITVHFSHFLYPDLSGSTTRLPHGLPDVWPHLSWMKKQRCSLGFSGHAHMEKTLIGNWHSLHASGKSTHRLNYSRTWLTCPPVVRGKAPQGFLTLDTALREISSRFTGQNCAL